MKRSIILIIILFLVNSLSAGYLNRIRSGLHPTYYRLVFDIERPATYTYDVSGDMLTLQINTTKKATGFSQPRMNSDFVKNFDITQKGENLVCSIRFNGSPKVFDVKGDLLKVIVDIKKTKPAQKPTTPKPKEETHTFDKLKDSFNENKLDDAKRHADALYSENAAQEVMLYSAYIYDKYGREQNNKDVMKKSIDIYENLLKKDSLNMDLRGKAADLYMLLGDTLRAEEHYAIIMKGFKEDEEETQPSLVDSSKLVAQEEPEDTISAFDEYMPYLMYGGAGLVVIILVIYLFVKGSNRRNIYDDFDDGFDISEESIDEVQEEILLNDDDDDDTLIKEESSVNFEDDDAIITKKESKDFEILEAAKKAKKRKVKPEPELEPEIEDSTPFSKGSVNVAATVMGDDGIKDRILELYEDGYTNREISEQVKTSVDEIDFIIRKHGGVDNELKKKNPDYINEQLGGVEDEEEPDVMDKVKYLYEEGISPREIANELDLDIDRVKFIISISQESNSMPDVDDEPVVATGKTPSEAPKQEEDLDKVSKIKELAAKGFGKNEVASMLSVGLDELEFIASMEGIAFKGESQVDVELDETPESDEEDIPVFPDGDDDDKDIPVFSEDDEFEPEVKPVKEESVEEEIEDIPLDEEDEEELKATEETPKSIEEKMKELQDLIDDDDESNGDDADDEDNNIIPKRRKSDWSEDDEDDKPEDIIRKGYNDDVVSAYKENKLSNDDAEYQDVPVEDSIGSMNLTSDLEKEDEGMPHPESRKTDKGLLKGFSAVESEESDMDIAVDEDDDDLRVMKQIYNLLDAGHSASEIAEKLNIDIDEVEMYQRIKSGDV